MREKGDDVSKKGKIKNHKEVEWKFFNLGA